MKLIEVEKIVEILSDLRAGYNCFDRDEIVGYEALSHAIARINESSFIEPKHGEWIIHFDDLFPVESTQECSICHAEQIINGNDDNFCPNCGADMRKYEEDE